MRIAESLRKNILESRTGGITTRFKIRKRRLTFFFEDILANYIKECEDMGYQQEIRDTGQSWMALYFKTMVPSSLKEIPPTLLLNLAIKKIWISFGQMDYFSIKKSGKTLYITTKNEGVTRLIGKNNAMIGFYMGVLNSLFRLHVEHLRSTQTKGPSKYTFRLGREPFDIESKTKEEYDRLNHIDEVPGFTLKDVLKKKTLIIKERNRLYFRNRPLVPVESTGFHIIVQKDMLPERIAEISYSYFRDIVKKINLERNLSLLKVLLQSMGWGTFTMQVKDRKNVTVNINDPPYGLQTGKDDWTFLINTILGYLWLLDEGFSFSRVSRTGKNIMAIYEA